MHFHKQRKTNISKCKGVGAGFFWGEGDMTSGQKPALTAVQNWG